MIMVVDNSMNLIGSTFFKGTIYGPAKYLSKRKKKFRLMNQEEMKRYDEKVKESKGFDVDGCTGSMPGRILALSGPCREWDYSVTLASFAASTRFPDNRLEGISLLKANIQAVEGIMYYLTFTAKDTLDEGKTKTFRAKVWRRPGVDLNLYYFEEFNPSKKAVTRHKEQGCSKPITRSKKSKDKKESVALRGAALAGFRSLCKKIKVEDPSLTHSKAMAVASEKWKSLSSAEKSIIYEASFKQA